MTPEYCVMLTTAIANTGTGYCRPGHHSPPAPITHSLLRTLAAAHWCHLPLGCLLGAGTASLRRESRVMVTYHRSQSFCLLLFHGDTFNLENFFVFWTSLRLIIIEPSLYFKIDNRYPDTTPTPASCPSTNFVTGTNIYVCFLADLGSCWQATYILIIDTFDFILKIVFKWS